MNGFSYVRPVVVATLAAIVLALGAGPAAAYLPDDRVVHSPAAISAGQSADIAPDDRGQHHPATITPPVMKVETSAVDRFDWADAGVGAATVLGLGLAGLGGSALVLRRRAAAFS